MHVLYVVMFSWWPYLIIGPILDDRLKEKICVCVSVNGVQGTYLELGTYFLGWVSQLKRWESILSIVLECDFCAGIGPLQLGVVLV